MIRYYFAALLMLCPMPLLFGFQGSPDNKQQVNVEGRVVNAQTGIPIPYALVELWASPRLAILTDQDGNFVFRNVLQGTLSFSIRKPGYFAPATGMYGNTFIPVKIGPETGKLEFKLGQESVITGQVNDSEDTPLEGAYVELHKVELFEGRRRLSQVGSKSTDEDGNFRFANLVPGRYYAVVKTGMLERRTLNGAAPKNIEAFPLIAYFPGSPDFAGATPIDLLAGQRERIIFTLKRKPTFRFSGVVSGLASYKTVNPPGLIDEWGQVLTSANHWDNRTGKFEFPPIPAGQYTFAVYSNTENRSVMQKVQILVDKDTPDFSMGLVPDLKIPVHVRYDRGPGVNTSQCAGTIPAANGDQVDCSTVHAMVSLISTETFYQQLMSAPESKENPALSISGVMPGKYIVQAMGWGGGHIHSLRCGSVDLLREPLVVAPGAEIAPIELVLDDEAGAITVHVHSDKPDTSIKVLLISQLALQLPPFAVDIQFSTDYSWGGLEPGDYKVYAFDSMDGIEYGNPEVMEKYAAKAASVTVTANSSSNVTVDVIRKGEE
jgi:Carboxypeptidase regulatory-like domain